MGEVPDVWRERKRQLLVANQMLAAPKGSLLSLLAREGQNASPKLGIFKLVENFLSKLNGSRRSIADFRGKKDIKAWIISEATSEWKAKVSSSDRLHLTYAHESKLEIRGYLKTTFPGQQVLTKIRTDDLDLECAGTKKASGQAGLCPLCGQQAETRVHFVVACPELAEVRQAHHHAMTLITSMDERTAFQTLILARPRGATNNIGRARIVARLLLDLWKSRTSRVEIRSNLA